LFAIKGRIDEPTAIPANCPTNIALFTLPLSFSFVILIERESEETSRNATPTLVRNMTIQKMRR